MVFDEFYIKSLVRAVPDWPRKGVTFRDITPVFQNPKALRMVADCFIQRYVDADITHVAAIDARGFLVGSIVAYALNHPLVLVRKKGKLPPETFSHTYDMEYGHATLEIHRDACAAGARVLVFDDLIATGGTIIATSNLFRKLGAEVSEAAAIIDLPDLQGSMRLQEADIPVYTLCAFESE